MRDYLIYLRREVLPGFRCLWITLTAMATMALGLWALIALPLIKVYPTCVDALNTSKKIEIRGKVTPEFNDMFIRHWRDAGASPITADRRAPIFYAVQKEIAMYITGGTLADVIGQRFPEAHFDMEVQQPPPFPRLFAGWYIANCDGLRKIALEGGVWADRGPDLWPDGDPDPDAPPIRRWYRR